MIHSTDPFNDPEIKRQVLESEGIEVVEEDPMAVEESVALDIRDMLNSAPSLPKSAKNIILDASAISKNEKDAKALQINASINEIISRYNKEYGTDINLDLGNLSNAIVAVSDPNVRRTLELYVSEVFKSVKPILLLHLLNRLVLCLDYVLDPKRLLDSNSFSPADSFLIIEKLQGYVLNLQDIIDQTAIKDSDAVLKKMADERNDSSLNTPESKAAVDEFMKLFKKDQGIES